MVVVNVGYAFKYRRDEIRKRFGMGKTCEKGFERVVESSLLENHHIRALFVVIF